MVRVVRFHEHGGPEVLRVEEAEPGKPGAGEVRIRVDALGLNRAEALFRAGTYGQPVRTFPAGLGYEAAGVVEALGEGVTGLAEGQRVSTIPAFRMNDYHVYGEAAIVPAHAVVDRPENVDAVTGSAVWMAYLTAFGGLVHTGGLRPAETVVLTAASSSVGLAAIQLARRLGARPVATTRTAAKREQLLAAGAAEVIVTDEEDVATGVLRVTEGRGADLVFDAVAGPGVSEVARATAHGGRIVLYGTLGGQTIEAPALSFLRSGVRLSGYSITAETTADAGKQREATAFVTAGLRDGTFRPVVDRVFEGLDSIREAHRHLESNVQIGKIVVTVPR
ncbi:zinc-dependent alcohol dehydrogenase family protein [Streptomyces hoynatensis]|uniref:NADPH:quinone reductase n=1 Tax=Streptomyces hoynatensis TaxID=1141874 RepID=A0A3A9Z3H7_9ACTN|nr:zinc-dependent alcohol dehydrogenase family protein [Streptomyces hoynatensis]RKN43001.1 NADPH:quinone reductase [Streptomyces hoynatensis]